MALILCKNSAGVWGWRDENSHQGYTKMRKTANNIIGWEVDPVLDINYTGKPISMTLPSGKYKMECWGASGGWGTGRAPGNPYGKGGYTSGIISFMDPATIWLYIGRRGSHFDESNFADASFNGGGYYIAAFNNGHSGGGGGGSSDIRLTGGNWNDATSLRSRIMVAAGGGGGQSVCGGSNTSAGHGGGLTGTQSYNNQSSGAYIGSYSNGGTQTAGGASWNNTNSWHYNGGFGYGSNSDTCGAGGGGGYYGGAASYTTGGGGGSSFVSGLAGCNAINSAGVHTGQPNHFSGLIFTNPATVAAVNDGNGAIKITLIEPYLSGIYLVKDGSNIGWRQIKKI